MRASFVAGGSRQQVVVARAGGTNDLRLAPVKAAAPKPVPRPEPTPQPSPAPQPAIESTNSLDTASTDDGGSLWSSRVLFFGMAGATAVLTGVTVWSGVDTINNPGAEAVRSSCVGQGSDCPAYQQGLSSQARTNGLIAASVVIGAATALVGLVVTNWSGREEAPAEQAKVSPWLGFGHAGVMGRF